MTAMRHLLGGAAICALASAALLVTPASADNVLGLKVYKEIRHDTSLPLRDMIRIYNEQHPNQTPAQHRIIPVFPTSSEKPPIVPDGIKGNGIAPGAVPTTDLLNFDGVDDAHSFCNCAPPDTNGAVGATQYVQWVNTAFAIYDKSTGALISGPTAGNALWQGFSGRCASSNSGDPIAQYDKAAGRWVMMQPVFSAPYKICVAVSQTSDATGSYNRYEFDKGNGDFPDYPKLGVWPASGNAAYFLTDNNFGNGFLGAEMCGLDRTAMIAGNCATMQCVQQKSSVASVLPVDFDGTTLPATGEDGLFFNLGSSSNVNFWHMHVDFANPNNTTLTGPVNVSVPTFTKLCFSSCVPQKGTTQKLDSLGDRPMYRLAYRNFGDHESIIVDHSVSSNTRGAVRWYEFRNLASPTLFQSGNIKNTTLWYWMGSIAMDKAGDMAVGFSSSSPNDFPSITYRGRTSALAAGKMQKHAGGNTTNGGGSQNGGLSRWGDYSAMSVDPVDDCTFYYTTEYLKQSGSFNWSTKVNSFKFNGCS
jgi:hypothetical protein